MPMMDTGSTENGQAIRIHYQDLGEGAPIVLIHGWPLSSASWEYQLRGLPEQGLRVIAYDRRGFGKSDQPQHGYDYNTLSDDLAALLDGLNLDNVTLVGFSMGGGEVARYMSRHGGKRVAKVVLVSAVTPYLLKDATNPDGVDRENFDQRIQALREDRFAFLSEFAKKFFNVGMLSHPVSQQTLDWTFQIASGASPKGTQDCVRAFSETDFRNDLQSIRVPCLIIHGEDDQTVPIAVSAERTAALMPQAQFVRYEGAPHGLNITHKDRLTADLASFAIGRVLAPT